MLRDKKHDALVLCIMYNEDEWEEFSPPDKGLYPSESILWSRRAGMAALWLFSGGCCVVSSPWILLFAFAFLGPAVGNIVFAIVLILILLALMDFIQARRTKYYLTTKRIIETRGGLIHKQISLESFQGVSASEYITVKSAYTQNGAPIYTAKIRDPATGKIIRLTGLDMESKNVIQNLGT